MEMAHRVMLDPKVLLAHRGQRGPKVHRGLLELKVQQVPKVLRAPKDRKVLKEI